MRYLKRCAIPIGIMITTVLIALLLAGAAGCSKVGVAVDGRVDRISPVNPPDGGLLIFPYERDGRKYLVFVYDGTSFNGGVAVVEIQPLADIKPTPGEMEAE